VRFVVSRESSQVAVALPADYSVGMPSKWVRVSSPETPAWETAQAALGERLEAVRKILPLAAHHHQEDVEHVHQLRVACRRADAALGAFAPLMTSKPKSLKKWLRRIRKAAGPARDADVLLERFRQESETDLAMEFGLARLARHREHVQQELVEVERAIASGKFERSITRSLEALQPKQEGDAEVSFAEYATESLHQASLPFVMNAGSLDSSITRLHELRIAGKNLRYSIEIFHAAFPEELKTEIYPLLVEVQSRLGQLNDHATAQKLFQQWLWSMPPDERAAQLARRIIAEHEATLQIRDEFLEWWTPKRIASIESFLREYC